MVTDSDQANSVAKEHPCSHCGFLQFESAYPDFPALPHHLLTNNDPPSDAEAIEIRDIMDAAHTRISNLDASMAMLKDILEQLRTTRKAAVEHLRQRSYIRYIRCLPDDVLGEIFSHAARDKQRSQPIPWILGHVCRRWRALSVSHPALWLNIESGLPSRIRTAHLERSKPHGLTVHLKYYNIEAVSHLVDCSSRWDTVNLDMGIDILPILDRAHGRVPMLRELTYTAYPNVAPCRAFEIAPKLTSVAITGIPPLHLPWPQITRLRQEANIHNLHQLAAACNLVELSLVSSPFSVPRDAPRSPDIELPCLRVLYVVYGEFLDFLVLPGLEDICISGGTKFLPPLIDRSSCCLRRFTSEDYAVGSNIIPILDRSPRLLELRLGQFPEVAYMTTHLTIPANSDANFRPPCPELRSISLCNIIKDHECSSVVEMVESRTEDPMCSALAISVFHVDRSNISRLEMAAEERLRAQGTVVDWCFRAARQRVDRWRTEYP
ncbi:hypothetical protein B0H17DRAFT_1141592 [Mycena rosella]|uniref:F-box domain-containing protein n=1 Tax=Mycena rosella TaxID=1033263 RepID=A0AAD7CZN1_MYCRO|nr:hypothetical protein B0H17DRAFT_1141592 [Mycena rosella]